MQSSPLQILSLLVLHSRCLFRVAVLDSWTPTVFSVSLHRNNQKNSNKTLRVGWEWTAQRQTNLSLLCICWPRHLLFFFSLTLYTDPHLSFSFFSSLTNTFFLHLSVTLNFLPSHSLGLWKGTAPHVLKDARKKKNMIPCERFPLWPSVSSEPDNHAARQAARLFSRDSFTEQLHTWPPNHSLYLGKSLSDNDIEWEAVNNEYRTQAFHVRLKCVLHLIFKIDNMKRQLRRNWLTLQLSII